VARRAFSLSGTLAAPAVIPPLRPPLPRAVPGRARGSAGGAPAPRPLARASPPGPRPLGPPRSASQLRPWPGPGPGLHPRPAPSGSSSPAPCHRPGCGAWRAPAPAAGAASPREAPPACHARTEGSASFLGSRTPSPPGASNHSSLLRPVERRRRDHLDAKLQVGLESDDLPAAAVLEGVGVLGVELDPYSARGARPRLGLRSGAAGQAHHLRTRDAAGAGAGGACLMGADRERLAQALAVDLEQPVRADAPDGRAGLVGLHRVAQRLLYFALVLDRAHVDEVDHHQAADVPEPELTGDLGGGFEVGLERRLLLARGGGGAAELTSIAVRASVRSITNEPPLGSGTRRS
jgi:hypothetical protein